MGSILAFGSLATRNTARRRDYARTFRVLNSIRPDVFLAQHPEIFDYESKRLKVGGPGTGRIRLLTRRAIASVSTRERKRIEINCVVSVPGRPPG